MPEQFVLALSSDGAARRKCRVAWRTGNQIGVEFLKEPRKTQRSAVSAAMRHFFPSATETTEEATNPFDIDSLSQRQS